ncbi:MAG: FtsK/SpoIIIE domain-containing protein [Longicatena sp.]
MNIEKRKIQINLYCKDYLDTLVLPRIREGRFWLYRSNASGKEKALEITCEDHNWYFIQNERYHFLEYESELVKIEENTIYKGRYKCEKFMIMCECFDRKQTIFYAYEVSKKFVIGIGRSEKNDIQYAQTYVSNFHARLVYEQDNWVLYDLHSGNGVYINNIRVAEKVLVVGDVIQIMRLKIAIGPGCFLLNLNNEIALHECFRKARPIGEYIHNGDNMLRSIHVHVLPRKMQNIVSQTFHVDVPPNLSMNESVPLIFLLGPSITMGLSSLVTGMFSIFSVLRNKGDMLQIIPTLTMSISMALGTILWPILAKKQEKKQRVKQEQRKRLRYCEYLEEIEIQIHKEIEDKERILQEFYSSLACDKQLLFFDTQRIWYRTRYCDSFLEGYFGLGKLPYFVQFEGARTSFQMQKDELEDAMRKLLNKEYEARLPYILPLDKKHCIAFIGKAEYTSSYLVSFLYHFAIQHSYLDVKFLILASETFCRENGLLWLPHCFLTEEHTHLLVSNEYDARRINLIVEDLIDEKHESICAMIVFSFDRNLEKRLPVLQRIRTKDTQMKVCYLQCVSDEVNIHQECDEKVAVYEHHITIDTNTHQIVLPYTSMSNEDIMQAARILANCTISNDQVFQLPETLSFLAMYQCTSIEQLNISERWCKCESVHSLEVPIGIGSKGEPLILDVHENYHGPHGLLAGMTGSGKSECVITYILSMAINFSPAYVSFLLIDYKGGSMAKIFENLPHVGGVITNLDQDSLQRSLLSLKSELTRRQLILLQTSKTFGIHNVDIYKYQALYREHKKMEPLTHLLIIADEFAELKTQQADFMEQLKQTARIGRSLGIHLILATQKPAGIIDDQIWSNSRFHLCLKVQDKSDSQDMLKRDDAAYLKKTGQCYLQVGNNEMFEHGLIAWTQAVYEEIDKNGKKRDEEIAIIDMTGQCLYKKNVFKKKQNSKTQLECIVAYIISLATQMHLSTRKLWKEALSKDLTRSMLVEKYPDQICQIGEIDDIRNQRQYPFCYCKEKLQNTLLYGKAKSGKTMLLKTLICAWNQTYIHPLMLLYIFDFDDESLFAFKGMHLIGDVVGVNDGEKIASFFVQLNKRIEKRKKRVEDTYPIVLIIHNFENFFKLFSIYEDALLNILREGEKYQIYIFLTLQNMAGIPYRMLQYFAFSIVLRMKEQSDYHTIFPDNNDTYPLAQEGSGILKLQEVVLFQSAKISESDMKDCLKGSEFELQNAIPILPKILEHKRKDGNAHVFLGSDVITKEDVELVLTPSNFYYFTGYRIPAYFYTLQLQQILDKEKHAYIISKDQIKSAKGTYPLVYLEELIKQEHNLYVWMQYSEIENNISFMNINEFMKQEQSIQIFIETIQELSAYTRYDWFAYSLFDAGIVYFGKGIQEHLYTLKINFQNLNNTLHANNAYLFNNDTYRQIQLWERESDG